jgi:nucleotide-binding universal stress UspA family protein
MTDIGPRQAVIVGIDGSPAAIHAAKWAAVDAVEQSVPLRMVAVVKTTHPTWSDYERDVERAQVWLQSARDTVESLGRPVKIETAVLRGQPGAVLIAESRDAEMVCVGSSGIDRYARALVGSTATEVAEKAHCPVAVIHSRPGQPEHDINWIVVAVNDSADRDVVVDLAMREAQRHKLPVLAIADTQQLSSHQLDRGRRGALSEELR